MERVLFAISLGSDCALLGNYFLSLLTAWGKFGNSENGLNLNITTAWDGSGQQGEMLVPCENNGICFLGWQ